ncbi:MAG: hypothetical protein AB9907_14720 [Flexilinea sp.]
MATLLNLVKSRLGIFYSDTAKDAEISQMIAGATAFLKNAGVPEAAFTTGSELPEAIEAIIIYCKMAMITDAEEMRINPILVALVAQMRIV